MTQIKLCGMRRREDILAANAVQPDFVGFILCDRFRRYCPPEQVRELRGLLRPEIRVVGVFVDQTPEEIATLLNDGTIDIAQLHGSEDEGYIASLRALTDRPLIRAFRITTAADIALAERSTADYILLDSGAGTGAAFDWSLLRGISRPWLLAGGLNPENAAEAVRRYAPWGMDVSSGIETGGWKDPVKMAAFAAVVRSADLQKVTP